MFVVTPILLFLNPVQALQQNLKQCCCSYCIRSDKCHLVIPFRTNDILSKIFTPSTVFVSPSTVRTSFPISREGLKSINGYLLEDGRISSSSIFSSALFLAGCLLGFRSICRKRCMNSCNSFIRSSFSYLLPSSA